MTSIDIYSILSNKPHNPHYLKRYLKFIESCNDSGTIKHHICPRAKDMFPEFASFALNSWNCSRLTPRQHFIAHWMLWKTFNSNSQMRAFYMLSHKDGLRLSSRMYAILTKAFIVATTGRIVSEETKAKQRGRKVSDETKKIQSEIKIEYFKNDENREKVRIARIGNVQVMNKDTGLMERIQVENYDTSIYAGVNHGKILAYDLETKEHSMIDEAEFNSLKGVKYRGVNDEKVSVRNIESGEIKLINCSEYHANKGTKYQSVVFDQVNCIDIETGESIRVSKEEYKKLKHIKYISIQHGKTSPFKDKTHTEEAKKQNKNNQPMLGKTGEGVAFFGKHHTEENKKKISERHKNQVTAFNLETKENEMIPKDVFDATKNIKYVGIMHKIARDFRLFNSLQH